MSRIAYNNFLVYLFIASTFIISYTFVFVFFNLFFNYKFCVNNIFMIDYIINKIIYSYLWLIYYKKKFILSMYTLFSHKIISSCLVYFALKWSISKLSIGSTKRSIQKLSLSFFFSLISIFFWKWSYRRHH